MSAPLVLLCAREGSLAVRVLSGAMADGLRVGMLLDVVPVERAPAYLTALATEWGRWGAQWAFASLPDLAAIRAIGVVLDDGAIRGLDGVFLPRLVRSIRALEVSRPDWPAAAVVVEGMAEAVLQAGAERVRTRAQAA